MYVVVSAGFFLITMSDGIINACRCVERAAQCVKSSIDIADIARSKRIVDLPLIVCRLRPRRMGRWLFLVQIKAGPSPARARIERIAPSMFIAVSQRPRRCLRPAP